MQAHSAIIFSNGNVAVFDIAGRQIPELQKSWINYWLEAIEAAGGDPTKMDIRMMVNGRDCQVKPFKTSDGEWNREIILI